MKPPLNFTERFVLTEFPLSNLGINIEVDFILRDSKIELVYGVSGDLTEIILPLFDKIERAGNLWENSCFEFFLAEKQNPEYREFNFSPSGKWNLYSFSSYRTNMKECGKVDNIEIKSGKRKHEFFLNAVFDFNLQKSLSVYEFQLAAILKTKAGTRRFFAIDNSSEKPDFHNRKFFINL